MSDIHVRLKKSDDFPRGGFDVCLYRFAEGGVFPAYPVDFQSEAASASVEPHVKVSQESAQELLDDLWEAGFRPSKATNNTGVMAAQDKHIGNLMELLRLAIGK